MLKRNIELYEQLKRKSAEMNENIKLLDIKLNKLFIKQQNQINDLKTCYPYNYQSHTTHTLFFFMYESHGGET